MKLTRLLVALAGLVLLNGVLAPISSALSPVVCQPQQMELRADMYASRGSFTNPADFKANYDKVNAAWPGLTAWHTPPETLQFLFDFQAAMSGLAAASPPGVDPVVAQRMVDRAQGIIDCVNANNP